MAAGKPRCGEYGYDPICEPEAVEACLGGGDRSRSSHESKSSTVAHADSIYLAL